MLLSMTGFGEAHAQADGLTITVETRTVNSRHFKLSFRSSDGYSSLEPNVEAAIRKHVRRGTVQLNLRIDHEASTDYRINGDVLASYRWQLDKLKGQSGSQAGQSNEPVTLASLLQLPGVVDEKGRTKRNPQEDWPAIEPVVCKAIAALATMRAEEGEALVEDLLTQWRTVAATLKKIIDRSPKVAEAYRSRLTDRVNKVLQEFDVTVGPADLVREVSLFLERSDISEEVVRLKSHLLQFEKTIKLPESSGRKLEFITQEMGRETNTIGSKANDPEISQLVIEIKAALERIREQIQNVE